MHAVIRSYSGAGATELIDLLERHKDEVESLIRAVAGFVSYTIIRTEGGGITITVCQDKAGTDESVQLARSWIEDNAADLDTAAPAVSDGPVVLQLS